VYRKGDDDASRERDREREEANEPHVAIEKAILLAQRQRLAAERRGHRRSRASLISSLVLSVVGAAIGFAFTGELAIAAVACGLGIGAGELIRLIDAIPPNPNPPPPSIGT
jgi:hypothetical protein